MRKILGGKYATNGVDALAVILNLLHSAEERHASFVPN
jgi:hypothetical protein